MKNILAHLNDVLLRKWGFYFYKVSWISTSIFVYRSLDANNAKQRTFKVQMRPFVSNIITFLSSSLPSEEDGCITFGWPGGIHPSSFVRCQPFNSTLQHMFSLRPGDNFLHSKLTILLSLTYLPN